MRLTKRQIEELEILCKYARVYAEAFETSKDFAKMGAGHIRDMLTDTLSDVYGASASISAFVERVKKENESQQ